MDKRNAVRGTLAGRASRYRTYSDALRVFASRLKAPDVRRKLLRLADELVEKASSVESSARTGRTSTHRQR